MSGRDQTPHHIREARQHVDADRWEKSNRRLRDVVAGTTREENSAAHDARYRWQGDDSNHLSERGAAAVRDALRRSAVVPAALAVPCAEHDATPGDYCGRGLRYVCMTRVTAGSAA